MLTIVEARGIDPTKRWRCVVRNHGQAQSAWQKTHGRRGEVTDTEKGVASSGPKWNQTFELRHSIQPATIVLVRVGSPMAAKKEVEVAYATVPRLGLSSGKCSSFWVDLKVIEGKDAAEALRGGGGWDDGDDDAGSPRAGGDSVEAKVEGIKNAFAQASAGFKKAFGGGGGAQDGGSKSGVGRSDTRKSGSRKAGGDADYTSPKLLVRVGFAPRRQLEYVASEAQLAPMGTEA